MATLDKYGYRKYLTEKGIKDEDITYDNGNVKVGGKFFASATPEADGSTYDTRANLDKYYNAYKGKELYDKYAGIATQKPPEVKVTPYKPLDTQTLMSNPAYQTGLQAAQAGAAIEQGNTLAKLRAGGQGKSSYSEGIATQIGQNAVSDFNARYIPSAMAQHYNQYLKDTELAQGAEAENYARNNAYADALKSVAGDYTGMYNDQVDQEAKTKATNIKNATDLAEQFGFGVLPKDSGEELFKQVEGRPTLKATTEQRQYLQELVNAADRTGYIDPELAAILGVPAGTRTVDAEAKLGQLEVSRRSADTASRAETRLTNQANQPKPSSGNSNADYKSNQGFSEDMQDISQEPAQALQAFQSRATDFISAYGYDGWQALVKEAERQLRAQQNAAE